MIHRNLDSPSDHLSRLSLEILDRPLSLEEVGMDEKSRPDRMSRDEELPVEQDLDPIDSDHRMLRSTQSGPEEEVMRSICDDDSRLGRRDLSLDEIPSSRRRKGMRKEERGH